MKQEGIIDLPSLFIVTGYPDITNAEALARGARRLFRKPFNINDLIDAVMEEVA